MKLSYKRFFSYTILLALAIQLLFMSACELTPVGEDNTGSLYLKYWAAGQYDKMFELILPGTTEDMDKDEFIGRYTGIYDGIGIMKVEVLEGKQIQTSNPDERILPFTLITHAPITGEIRSEMSLNLKYDQKDERWFIIWSSALIFPGMEEGDTVRLTTVAPTRGEIFDKNGNLLVKNTYNTSVAVSLSEKERNGESDDTLIDKAVRLSELLEMDRGELEEKLLSDSVKQSGSTVITTFTAPALCYDGREGISDELKDQLSKIPGVFIDTSLFSSVRYYPYRDTLCHILGYTSVITKEDVLSGRTVAGMERTGRTGLEEAYEEQLRGVAGYTLAIYDSNGTLKKTIFSQSADNGVDLTLSIDLDEQQYAENLLQTYLLADQAGVAIVMDPTTGLVSSIASEPGFDLNMFLFPVTQEQMDIFNEPESKQPLFGRALQGRYPPGSTIKPLTAAMAMQAGAINENYEFLGEITNNKWTPTDVSWYYPPISRQHGYDGSVNMENAISESDNIYFASIALKTGIEKATEFFNNKLGLDSPMPFDLPLGKSILSRSGEIDDIKFLADIGYGQGELLFTPLQLAATFSALANGGNIIQPRIVEHTDRMNGEIYERIEDSESTVWKSDVVSQHSLDVLLPMLEKVVTSGTGYRAAVPGMRIYGKTGTAEIGGDKSHEIAWFVAFTRGENSKLVLVMIETKEGEGSARMDIARELFKYGTDQQKVMPYTPEPSASPEPEANN